MARLDLTAERLRSVLDYNQATGVFTWRVAPTTRHVVGGVAGSRTPKGYIQIMIAGENYLAHRLAWLHVTGEWLTCQIDHDDTDKANNAWSNLRPATDAENKQNRITGNAANKSGYLGVCWHKAASKWVAQIKKNGKRVYLGLFDDPEAAHAEYVRAKRALHPFGNL